MRVALWQTEGVVGQVAANLAALERQLQAAAAGGAQLLLCPELWLGGYNVPAQMPALAESADGPAAQAIAQLCQRYGVAVCYGYAERVTDEDALYNSAQVIDQHGQRIAHYRKTHLFGAQEKALFKAGDALAPVFELNGWRMALLICFDVEFAETVRMHALAGAELVLVPTALSCEYRTVPELIVPARAVENQVFVAYCNHSGEENGLAYLGGSCVAAPNGERLGALSGGEGLLLVELMREQQAQWRALYPYLADRRPQLYGPISQT